MAQKETILGNYTSFPRFPLDCESMDYIQNNTKLLAVIAQIAGCDKLIIKGCTGSPRTEGYVYVRTGDDLVGEILYYGGGTGVRCSIATDNFDTTANGETFANAYTKRKLVSGTTGTWAWSEFKTLSEITNAALKAAVDGKAASNHNHDTAYAAKIHNHDDRYYTEEEIDSKISRTKNYADNLVAVQTGTALSYSSLFTIKKIGKIVFVAFKDLDGAPDYGNYEDGATQHRTLGIVIPEGFRPSTTVFGIGICSNSRISTDYIGNRPQFWIEPSGKLAWFNPNEGAPVIHGNICYITN